ncbi:hypothetical protein 035JT004_252 [Bacillus phage 035JT004]|nr:hypothetical protein 035JT004_252 [Bacillus phage 035JT004]
MNVPLRIVKVGKTDEYIKLVKRREHFIQERPDIEDRVLEAFEKLDSFKPFITTYEYTKELGSQVQAKVLKDIKETATEGLLANEQLRRIDETIKAINSEIDNLAKEDWINE